MPTFRETLSCLCICTFVFIIVVAVILCDHFRGCMGMINGSLTRYLVYLDECTSQPCQHQSSCIANFYGYTCQCVEGYTGPSCSKDIDECASSPCNFGVCHDRINGYNCECSPGFTGSRCESDINECDSHPCRNGARCLDRINGYRCECQLGYEGTWCERQRKDKSESSIGWLWWLLIGFLCCVGLCCLVEICQGI